MTRLLCLLSALHLLSGCSSADTPPEAVGGTGGGAAGGAGGAGTAGPGSGSGGSGDARPEGSGGLAGTGGSGGVGGAARDGAVRTMLPDASGVVPDVPVPADAFDAGSAMDAAAPDVRPRSDARPPDGGFRYPDPDGRLCGNARHTLAKTPAELLVVLDRSNSMAEATSPGRTRWDDARDAVINAVTSSSNLAWGLKVFPSISMGPIFPPPPPPIPPPGMIPPPPAPPAPPPTLPPVPPAPIPGGGACGIAGGVEVAVGFGRAGVIGNALMHAGPPTAPLGSGTPTEPAILAGTAYLKAVTTALPKYMVLVTDGQPTCATSRMGVLANPVSASVEALSAAAAGGIKTFVIGIRTAAFTANLNLLADAGGMPRAMQPRYYPAENRADLDAALQAITVAVTTCVFPLVTRPLDPDFVGVTVGSTPAPRDLDRIDGWDYVNNGTAIEIYGRACDALKTGAAQTADIHFGCPTP
jgi:hypothetical protein